MRLIRTLLGLAVLTGFVAALIGFSVVLAVVDKYGRDLPDYKGLATYMPRTGSEILAADGTLLGRRAEQRRTFVAYAQIPPLVRQAFISAEDRNFFSHGGVDPVAVVRAILSNATGGVASGASTITQQVAKNLLVGNEHSLARKVREALLAQRMDSDLGKPRILEIYFNEIYLGLGAYGVAEAASTYFGKSLSDLTPAEAALIAAMPKAPSLFNPERNPDRAKERRNYVLRRMAEDGALSLADSAAAQSEPINLADRGHHSDGANSQEAWFQDLAWKQALAGLPADLQSRQDIIIHSTLNPDLQAAADEALKDGILRADQRLGWRGPLAHVTTPVKDWNDPELTPPAGSGDFALGVVESVGAEADVAIGPAQRVRLGADGVKWTGRRLGAVLRVGDVILLDLLGERPQLVQMPEVDGALIALDPRNGDVLALVGGFSRERSQFDRSTQARRQAGSAFKPILYSSALEIGFDATSPILVAPISIEQGPGREDWRPTDAHADVTIGLLPLRKAMEQSNNIAAARIAWTVGLTDVADAARRLGISGQMTNSAALGTMEVSPLQMATAYAAFANGGKLPTPRFVSELRSRDGTLLRDVPPVLTPAIDPIAATQMASILRGVVERGTAKQAFSGFARYVAGKTGTTNAARDAWFVGFASDVVVAVWIGRDDNKALYEGAYGGIVAAPVVRSFLEHSGAAFTLGQPPILPGLVETTVDPETGLRAKTGQTELVRADSPLLASPLVEKSRAAPRRRAVSSPVVPDSDTAAKPSPPDDYQSQPAHQPEANQDD